MTEFPKLIQENNHSVGKRSFKVNFDKVWLTPGKRLAVIGGFGDVVNQWEDGLICDRHYHCHYIFIWNYNWEDFILEKHFFNFSSYKEILEMSKNFV